MRSIFLDCESGISGDMIVASLLDLGADEDVMKRALDSFKDDRFTIKVSRVTKSGLDCCDFDVVLDKDYDNHDHDMDYLYGHNAAPEESGTGHEHTHGHHHSHADHKRESDIVHDHSHGHSHGHDHEHVHRTFEDVREIIESLDITASARELAVKVFEILAAAEAKAHATDVEKVHFHEVGAIDSIADIVAAAVCFDDLAIDKVYVPRICDGHGTVRCQHGIIPVPVPAVMNIAAAEGLPLSITNKEGEYVTPTGAAFAAAVMTDRILPETIVPVRIGMGAGKRDYAQPGLLRAVLFEE